MTLQQAFSSHQEEDPCVLPETGLFSDLHLPPAGINEEVFSLSHAIRQEDLDLGKKAAGSTIECSSRCPETKLLSPAREEPPPSKRWRMCLESGEPLSPPAMGYSRCDKCGEDLPSDYFSEHTDYHLAQELHQTLNSPLATVPTHRPASGSSPHKMTKGIKVNRRTRTHKLASTSPNSSGSAVPSRGRTNLIHSFFNRLPSNKDSL